MAAPFDLSAHEWPALTSLTEHAANGTQNVNLSEGESEGVSEGGSEGVSEGESEGESEEQSEGEAEGESEEESEEASEGESETVSEVLMHCVHFMTASSQAARPPCTPHKIYEPC